MNREQSNTTNHAEWVITDAFRCIEEGDLEGFFRHVDDDVEWTIMGSHSLAGTYYGKASLRNGSFVPMNRDLKDGAEVRIRHQFVCGNQAVVEAETIPTDYAIKATPYSYCWVLEVTDGLITRARAYIDASLILKMTTS